MHHWERRKMKLLLLATLALATPALGKSIPTTDSPSDDLDNNIIDFDDDYSVKFDKKYANPWQRNNKFDKDTIKYTVVNDNSDVRSRNDKSPKDIVEETTINDNLGVLPLELISTTENTLLSIIDSTTEPDLTVIPLSTTKRTIPVIEINQTVTLPSSTQSTETSTENFYLISTENDVKTSTTSESSETTTTKREVGMLKEENVNKAIDRTYTINSTEFALTTEIVTSTTDKNEFHFNPVNITDDPVNNKKAVNETVLDKMDNQSKAIETSTIKAVNKTVSIVETTNSTLKIENDTKILQPYSTKAENITITYTKKEKDGNNLSLNSTKTENKTNVIKPQTTTKLNEGLKSNTSNHIETKSDDSKEDLNSETDDEDLEVPEDYYDAKDIVPTTAPKNDALSVIFGLAGSVVESVVESVAERVVPKGIYDLFKRMQKQSEALEAERLRSREENGGLGQFGRGILKSISTGLSRPLSQLMAGAKDIGSLDTDRGFVSSLASGVSSVASAATSLADSFKDKVQAIYPGTVWCGDGHSAQARSGSELGLFFFTDTCCKEHDSCKIFIPAGDTKYGLTNTGLFTRSHCGCDLRFRECLRKTNSLVSAQIGLTYFNVLGPQCFRKAHPIVRCVRRTRITGQKCEEYELDYTKPKMWQWFDNETF